MMTSIFSTASIKITIVITIRLIAITVFPIIFPEECATADHGRLEHLFVSSSLFSMVEGLGLRASISP